MRNARFGGVNNIVGCHRVNGHAGQRAVNQHVMAGGVAVADTAGYRRRYRVVGLTQCGYRRCRNGDAPVAGGVGRGGVILPVQRHGDGGINRLIAGAGDLEIGPFFAGVNHIIARNAVNADKGRGSIDRDGQ